MTPRYERLRDLNYRVLHAAELAWCAAVPTEGVVRRELIASSESFPAGVGFACLRCERLYAGQPKFRMAHRDGSQSSVCNTCWSIRHV